MKNTKTIIAFVIILALVIIVLCFSLSNKNKTDNNVIEKQKQEYSIMTDEQLDNIDLEKEVKFLIISAVSSDGNPLENAEFEIYDEDKSYITKAITTRKR